jgi:glycosyltransferase involved in cell wall biosynthesis
MATLCLVMIVKNESAVITRCLESVVNLIDYWVIHDTGSSDDTVDKIQSFLKIKGELHITKWDNYAKNRTLAVQDAFGKSDYLLFLDADETLIVKNKEFKTKLTDDAYYVQTLGNENLDHWRCLLVKGNLRWRYESTAHEYIVCESASSPIKCDFVCVNHFADGGNRPDKFKREVGLLKTGLKTEPKNARYMFYLGQAFYDNSDFKTAISWYTKCISYSTWDEERYYAMYRKALCFIKLNYAPCECMAECLKAYLFRPTRLEALVEFLKLCRLSKNYQIAINVGLTAANQPYSSDILFVEPHAHNYLLLDELAMSLFYVGRTSDAFCMGQKILDEKKYPVWDKDRLCKNMEFYRGK